MPHRPGVKAILAAAVLLTASLPSAALAQETAAPSQAAASTAPASGVPSVDATALADTELGAPLEPGRYVDRSVGRDISFDLGEGWSNAGPIDEAGLALVRDEPGGPYLYIGHFPGEVFPPGCGSMDDEAQADAFFDDVTTIEPTAAAFMEHLAAMPELTVSAAVPVEAAGFEGLQLDVSGVDVDDDCMPPWAWLWVLPVVGDYHLSDGAVARIVALDADGQVVVVVMEATPEADFEAFLAQGAGILESMEIGPLS